MSTVPSVPSHPDRRSERRRLAVVYAVEACISVGSTLFMSGIFFYTRQRLHWTLGQNFALAAAQGAAYACGALSAWPLAARLGRGRLLLMVCLLLAGICAAAAAAGVGRALVVLLIVYPLVSAIAWPVLESLVAAAADPRALARRIGGYNLVWATTSALSVAAAGSIIEHVPAGMFLLPAAAAVVAAALVAATRDLDTPPARATPAAPDPGLHRQRSLALWLSRIALPATYVLIYSILPMMPSLPLVSGYSPAAQTLVCSVWFVARVLMFVVLMATAAWHTRPRLLVLAAWVTLAAFIAIVLPPRQLWAGQPWAGACDLAWIIAAQVVLGAALGLIYFASLYFGMVLSDASTEHGGYHEALIGLGAMVGPATGAVTQVLFPDNLNAGITAVGGVIALSVIAVAVASRAGRTPTPAFPQSTGGGR